MKQALIKKGKVYAEEVPAPVVEEGHVLIKVVNSCISVGTELSGVTSSGESLIKKADSLLYFAKNKGRNQVICEG